MKKILSLVLVLSLVLGSFSMAFAANADVEGTKYEEAVTRLAALKVLGGYEDGTFKPEKTITRAEFAKIMANVTGVGAAAQYANGQTKFVDVPATHWAAGYINVVSDMGIITGYGDGNFGPEDQVKYQDAITMVVRALGYKPKADGMGGYPGGYLAVAAEEEITDDVNVVAVLPATRGDVALMVDNSLTVPLMEQKGYGTLISYEVDKDKNLMKKLDVDEFTGRVIAIPQTDKSLDDDEIILAIEDKDDETLTMKTDVDYMTLLGTEVKVWADSSDVFFVDVQTDAKDIIFDTVSKVDSDEISLKVDDETYDFDKDVKVYVNFKEEKVKDIAKDMYGYVVLNKKDDVVAVNLFNFDVDGELVTKVDGEDVELEGATDIDLGDYDDTLIIYDKNFKVIDKDEIKVNSVVNYFADGDEAWFVVVNETKEGTLKEASSTEITVDSDDIDVRSNMVYSLDNNDDMEDFSGATDLKDLMDEQVTVVLDLDGEARLVTGDVKETTGIMFALFQKKDSGFDAKIKVIDAAGETQVYEFEDDDDFTNTPNDSDVNELVAFELNKDGKIADGTFMNKSMIDAHADYVLETVGSYDIDDDGYIERSNDRFYVEDDTVFFNIEDGDGEDLKFDDIKDVDVKLLANTVVKETNGNDLVAVVFVNAGVAAKATNYAVVTGEPKYDGDWKIELRVAGEGEKTYAIGGSNVTSRKANYTSGKVLSFRLNSSNEIVDETFVALNANKTVTDVNGKNFEITTNGWSKVDSDALVVVLEEDGDFDKTIGYDDIEKDDSVYFLENSSEKLIVMAKVTNTNLTPGGDGEVTDGNMAFFDADDNELSKVTLNNGEDFQITAKFKNIGTSSFVVDSNNVVILDNTGSAVTSTNTISSSATILAGKTVTLGTVSATAANLPTGEYTLLVRIQNADSTPVKFEKVMDISVVASKDATLSALKYKVGATETAVPGFSAGTTSYTVQLPSGTTGAYTLVGTANSGLASVGTASPATAVETDGSNEATIKVTAEDTSSTETYKVTFVINNVPAIVSAIEDKTFEVAATNPATVKVDIDGVFEDNETSDLTYSVTKTADEATATVNAVVISGDEVIIEPSGAAGDATFEVTATDEAGESVTDTFTVTFTNP